MINLISGNIIYTPKQEKKSNYSKPKLLDIDKGAFNRRKIHIVYNNGVFDSSFLKCTFPIKKKLMFTNTNEESNESDYEVDDTESTTDSNTYITYSD